VGVPVGGPGVDRAAGRRAGGGHRLARLLPGGGGDGRAVAGAAVAAVAPDRRAGRASGNPLNRRGSQSPASGIRTTEPLTASPAFDPARRRLLVAGAFLALSG